MTKRGFKYSEEHCKKLSEKRKGRKLSEAHIEAIKASHHTPEFHEKQSASHSGKKLSEMHRQAIIDATNTPEAKERASRTHKGKTMSEAQKQLLSEIMNSEDVNRRISEAVRRAYDDPEMRERQYQATLAFMSTPEYSQKMSESIRKLQATEEWKANHKAAMANPDLRALLRSQKLGIPLTEEHRQKLTEGASERALARWAKSSEEERREHMQKALLASQAINTSRLEIQIKALLDALGVAYEQQYRIGRYLADFFVASENLVIEANGCWWHSCPQCGYTYEPKQQADAKREAYIRKKGYNMLVIWEHEMKSDLASVLNSLLEGDS